MKNVSIGSNSGPYFPPFELNTKRYSPHLSVFSPKSACGKIQTRKTPNTDTFHSLLKCHGWVYLLIQFNKNFTLLQHKFNVPTLKNSTNQNEMQNMKLSFYCFCGNSIICSFAAYGGVHSSVSIITFLTSFFSCYAINFYWKICKHVCMRLKLHLSVCWLQDITIELKSVESGLWYC